jgi:hypothetical protein
MKTSNTIPVILRLSTGKLKTVQGYAFTVPTMSGYSFAVHETREGSKYWSTTELSSGLSCNGALHSTNRSTIIADCIERFAGLKESTREEFRAQIASMPLVDEPTAMQQLLDENARINAIVDVNMAQFYREMAELERAEVAE